MPISIISHREPEPLDPDAFVRLAEFVLDREDVQAAAELSLALVDVVEMAELNERYRGIAAATDVLSFPCDDPCPVQSDEPVTLGDVVIAPEVAEKQAHELGHTVEEELNLLVIHGILHLLGYDHESDEDATVMQARQVALLEAYTQGL